SSQAHVPYHVKTAYGLTDPFIVNGVTKQGGSLSPLKCTLTTSMCNRWLSDLTSHSLHHLVISSEQARKHLPHSSLDNIKQPITMVEAMDDTLLISVSLSLLLFLARHAYRFQGTYG
ncbi:hypothetical protein L208DRAFT_1513716, partial [Tricholoma matsutake]